MNRPALIFGLLFSFTSILISWKEPLMVMGYSQQDEIKAGKLLISQSDCRTCHRDDYKLVGPSFKEIAIKYAAQKTAVNYLSEKIIKGGGGVWGEVKMQPHPTITKTDARKMSKYILSLK